MKGKKLLAGVISAAMLLGSMSFTAFASAEVATSEAFATAVTNETTEIKLTGDVKLSNAGAVTSLAENATIDLDGHTLTLEGYGYRFINTTFKNGKINVTTGANNNGDGVFGCYNSTTLTFDNVELTAENLTGPYLISSNAGTNYITLKNATKFNVTAVSTDEKPFYAVISQGIVVVEASEIVASGVNRGIVNANTIVKNNSTINISAEKEAIYVGANASFVTEGENTITASPNAKAKIGEVQYATVAEALAAANDNDTITLISNATMNTRWDISKKVTLDLNGKILTMPAVTGYGDGAQYIFKADTTFKNGTINVTDGASTAVFYANENNPTLTFDGVVVNAENIGGCYLFGNNCPASKLHIVNGSKINVTSDGTKELIAVIATNGDEGQVEIEDSDITVTNLPGKVILWGDVTIKGDSKITANVKGHGIQLGNFANDALKIVANDEGKAPVINITANNDDKQRYGIFFGNENVTYTKDDAAVVNTTFRRDVSEENVTAKINVVVESAGTNGEYNIVLKADENKKINEFVNAELKIATTAPGYEVVEANDNVTIIKNNAKDDVYSFNYTSAQRDVVSEIVIGKIVIPAVGTYEVGVDKNYANKVIATKHNTTDEQEYAGDSLSVADATSATVAQAKRDVKVNIEFEHDINANVTEAYNNMKVTLKDVFGVKTTKDVEVTGVNAGNVEFTDVPAGLITVTLEAPGFRKYTYQTNLEEGDAALELKFWNSVKLGVDNKVEVNGKVMNHNFLVGDIAMDYVIDDYDLAAVTSYYGTYDINDSNAAKLVKYDLNRDGNIDITDVAYVLHSLGY